MTTINSTGWTPLTLTGLATVSLSQPGRGWSFATMVDAGLGDITPMDPGEKGKLGPGAYWFRAAPSYLAGDVTLNVTYLP